MKKFLVSLLIICMVISMVACTKTNEPTVKPTNKPVVTNIPTDVPTDNPTVEPTIEPTEAIDSAAKDAYYAEYVNSEDFGFAGTSAKLELTSEEYTLISIMYSNYMKWQIGEQHVTMLVKDGKMYVQSALLNSDTNEMETVSYVSTIPEGENPLIDDNNEIENPDETTKPGEDDVTFKNLKYVETLDYEGQQCDKVTFESDDGNGFMYVTVDTHKIIYMESIDKENTKTIITYYTENDIDFDVPTDAEEIEYEEAKMVYSMSLVALLFSTTNIEE